MLQAAMAEAGVAADATWVIGDTAFDIGMAQAAGARSIGVDWGYHEPEELIAAGADRVISSAIELISVLEETS
jgi:phosphoglycolate phosphatase